MHEPRRRRAGSRALIFAAAGSGLALALAALAGPTMAGGPAAVVEMTDALTFEPRRVEIAAGETVLWRNESVLVHTVTADPEVAAKPGDVRLPRGAEAFDSGDVEPGGGYRRTFETPGNYRYFCVPHEAAGMVGELVVSE